MIGSVLWGLLILGLYLRVRGRPIWLRIVLALLLPLLVHPMLLWYAPLSVAVRIGGIVAVGIALGWLHLLPCLRPGRPGLRVQLLVGGRALICDALYAGAMQLVLFALLTNRDAATHPVADPIVMGLLLYGLLINGVFRVLLLSTRLGVIRRVLILLFWWVPGVGLLPLWILCRKAEEEYDHICIRRHWQGAAESDACATKYPLVLLHGVGFRDLKYFNYWGRIPRELERQGAKIHYGNQEAWGTIEANAADVKAEILRVCAETGCEKVNLIAHSKGGLDARYMIGALEMADYVASVTTICTPHHGSRLGDLALRLPNGLYRWLTGRIDRSFRLLGDKNPDAFNAARQFSSNYSADFNRRFPQTPGIYWQSYAAAMSGPLSSGLLALPYLLMRLAGARQNDGLVTIDSARWGEFRGVFCNHYRRGVSHGDAIDLMREDYRDFDLLKTYVGIVSELRGMGF